MRAEVAKYLHDVAVACRLLQDFTADKSFVDFQGDALLRAGVEREFITIGEALSQAEILDPLAVQSITSLRQIIGFRNVLAHGYAVIDQATVWGVVENHLPLLQQQVTELLVQAGPP
jgi:uncharacterized protein with HEPN domain